MTEEEFTRELASLLNRASAENGSNTPDLVLADYLRTCLRALDEAINARSKWYGRHDSPGSGAALTPPGHALVGPDARERIARALNESHRRFDAIPISECYDCDCVDDDEVSPPPFDELCAGCRKSQGEEADAVLAALGVRG